jgi:H+/Cl- antiporter ClcA
MLAVAGTIGALFGTPVAAALLLTQRVGGDAQTPMWDRLFAPLVAAGVGAITTALIAHPDFALPITPYGKPQLVDLLSGTLICLVAVAAGLVVLYLFPLAHRQFHRLPHPVLALGSGGCVLGLLGLLGGALSLFKGLDEMQQMAAHVETIGTSGLALLIVVKLAALLVSATCGFRGGRIFPVVFAGTGLGLLTNQLLPAVPVALAIACSVMGFTLVVTRDGWLSIFVGAAVVPSLTLLPVLCLIMLPAWLVVAGQPPMLISAHTPLQPPADQPHR